MAAIESGWVTRSKSFEVGPSRGIGPFYGECLECTGHVGGVPRHRFSRPLLACTN